MLFSLPFKSCPLYKLISILYKVVLFYYIVTLHSAKFFLFINGSFTLATFVKWCLHRQENIYCCCYHQRWQFKKIGEFLMKSHRSAKSLDPHCVCVRTFK
jgi:hypothetical protein